MMICSDLRVAFSEAKVTYWLAATCFQIGHIQVVGSEWTLHFAYLSSAEVILLIGLGSEKCIRSVCTLSFSSLGSVPADELYLFGLMFFFTAVIISALWHEE